MSMWVQQWELWIAKRSETSEWWKNSANRSQAFFLTWNKLIKHLEEKVCRRKGLERICNLGRREEEDISVIWKGNKCPSRNKSNQEQRNKTKVGAWQEASPPHRRESSWRRSSQWHPTIAPWRLTCPMGEVVWSPKQGTAWGQEVEKLLPIKKTECNNVVAWRILPHLIGSCFKEAAINPFQEHNAEKWKYWRQNIVLAI